MTLLNICIGFIIGASTSHLFVYYFIYKSRKEKAITPSPTSEDLLEKRGSFIEPDPILTAKKKRIWNAEDNAIRLDRRREKENRVDD